ncbi:MAG TPA: DNA replication/repair protein RecF [Geminicoccaceae bacterium]|nr:DNA replication/repair protein RecF [Geminicoccaceae bacterium]
MIAALDRGASPAAFHPSAARPPADETALDGRRVAGMEPLALERLTLTDFRGYARLTLRVDPRPVVVLTGPNGAGKTNLLEAISFLTPGRGLRRARLAEIDRWDGGGPWAVAATLRGGPRGEVAIGTGRDPNGNGGSERERRAVRIDGEPTRRQADLAGVASAVWLTPAMDRLFTEAAGNRRRFLDRLVFTADPAHAEQVGAYEHALRERSRLLRTAGTRDPAWLGALERRAAAAGVAVAAARREVVRELQAALSADDGPFPRAGIAVAGEVEGWLDGGEPALAAEERLREALAASRRQDALTGGAAVGPHRSDLVVADADSGRPAAEESTGRQKALLISIVLAEARLRAARGEGLPLLLLDEVAAHLDPERRRDLFDALLALGAQAWLTGTDAALFEPLGWEAQFFTVRDATVV